jgi:impB/mucB/samB family
VQYNPNGTLETFGVNDSRRHDNESDGGIIAISYEARAKGVTRQMRGIEARKLCPELQLVTVRQYNILRTECHFQSVMITRSCTWPVNSWPCTSLFHILLFAFWLCTCAVMLTFIREIMYH